MKKFVGYIITGGISVIAGTAFGFWRGVKSARERIKFCGALRVDNSEKDEQPKLYLEITDVNALEKSNIAIFEIKRENYIWKRNNENMQ